MRAADADEFLRAGIIYARSVYARRKELVMCKGRTKRGKKLCAAGGGGAVVRREERA